MEWRVGNLRFRRRVPTPMAGPTNKVKAGRWVRYNKNTGKESSADSVDVFATPRIAGYPSYTEERCWDALHPGPPFNQGGPFALLKIDIPNFNVYGSVNVELGQYLSSPTLVQKYVGGFYNPVWIGSLDTAIEGEIKSFQPDRSSVQFNPTGLDSLANTAYQKLRPKVEVAGLGQAIAEFRDVPRTLQTTAKGFAGLWRNIAGTRRQASVRSLKDALQAPKSASNQFLNTAFGWMPFVKDVNDVCNVIVNGHDIIARKKSKNAKWQRRTFHEDEIQSETQVYTQSLPGCLPADDSTFRQRTGMTWQAYTITREIIERVWYVGEFKYYYPEFDDNSWEAGFPALQRAHQYASILGAKVDPVLLYKVTPWTWMVDWFTDMGAGLQRLQDLATDSTVSKYFYVMRQRTYRYRLRCRFSCSAGNYDLSWYYGATAKMRGSGSSPFGVNLKTSQLSGFQLAIMGALGLSKWTP